MALRRYLIISLITIILATASIISLRYWVVEGFEVPSNSMLPTFRPGDRVWVNKLSYRFSSPSRGDVVVFPQPKTGELYVKRIIGLPGERITVLGRQVLIGGTPLENFDGGMMSLEPKAWGLDWPSGGKLAWATLPSNGVRYRILLMPDPLAAWRMSGTWRVPEGYVFVMGDNRDDSSDSRDWGSISIKSLTGHVVCRVDAGNRAVVDLPARTSCDPDAEWEF